MKNGLNVGIVVSVTLFSTHCLAVDAAAARALDKSNGCYACHTVDEQVIGPSYKSIAKKYRGNKSAQAKLVESVKNGSSKVWGPIPMPASSPRVKEEDIQTIVEWVLSLK